MATHKEISAAAMNKGEIDWGITIGRIQNQNL